MIFDELSTHNYSEFLRHFLDSEYALVPFRDAEAISDQPFAVLRHDVDFDCELAYKAAEIEHELNVNATYFFLISSESYNVAAAKNRDYINGIAELGHEISIHFDPLVYEDFVKGFSSEKAFFESLFDVEVKVISIHRPTPFFLDYDRAIDGVEHTYQSKYVEQLKYFSDSTGIWRYGHPANSPEFAERKNLHILVHPIWWTVSNDGSSNTEKIKSHYLRRIEQVKNHYAENCKPFLDIYDTV